MSTKLLKTLRRDLEDERRKNLGFSRALDHLGFAPDKLDWASLRQLHERDADAAELLYGLERGFVTSANVSECRTQLEVIRKDTVRLRARVTSALPSSFQKRLKLALLVADSTISRDDLYDDIWVAP